MGVGLRDVDLRDHLQSPRKIAQILCAEAATCRWLMSRSMGWRRAAPKSSNVKRLTLLRGVAGSYRKCVDTDTHIPYISGRCLNHGPPRPRPEVLMEPHAPSDATLAAHDL